VVFSGLPPGSTYNWTNSNTAIGLGAAGTGNIPAFTATNGTAAPITATITVTPSSTGCGGLPVSFTITVNPTPSVNAIANQTLCAGATTAAVTLSGPVAGTVYTWTNNNTTIGLGASGIGNIPAFETVNPTINPVTATITVTPTYTNGGVSCTGPTRSFTITVNPLPNIVFIDMPQRACLTDTIITLKTNVGGGTWSGPGVSGNTFSAAAAGIGVHRLTYTVTNGFGCSTQRFTNMVVNDCIERHQVFQTAIRIWPNPNNGRFSLQFNSDKYKEFKVKVVNARGQEMGYYEFKNLVYGQILPFDLSRVADGVYYIYVYNTQESGVFPVVIQR
jgi:Secretion system C-terminal sorting domain/PKD-like domain